MDLDEPLSQTSLDRSAALVPRVYCAILRTVVLNSMTLSLDRICIDVSPGKCNGALHIARVLADTLPIPVECTENRDTIPFSWTLCQKRYSQRN